MIGEEFMLLALFFAALGVWAWWSVRGCTRMEAKPEAADVAERRETTPTFLERMEAEGYGRREMDWEADG